MVLGSDFCYRLLAKKYNTELTYTPMLYPKIFVASKKYRKEHLPDCDLDRPRIVQFCGTSIGELLPAALLAQSHCEAIDINLGCPQRCARQGGYGAFMMEKPDLVFSIVKQLSTQLSIPVLCKMRILPSIEETIQFAIGLEKSGCQLLVVHGRTKEQKGISCGPPNWDIVKLIKQTLTIPVINNGGLRTFSDIDACLKYTGCDGVMSAEAMLLNPAFFSNTVPHSCDMAIEYLELCKQYNYNKRRQINAHIYGLITEIWNVYPYLRKKYYSCSSIDECIEVLKESKWADLNKPVIDPNLNQDNFVQEKSDESSEYDE